MGFSDEIGEPCKEEDLKQIMLNRIPMFFTTVVQKLNQGTSENGRSRFPMHFFGSFLCKQKRTEKTRRRRV
jgi:hypothetical protein